MEDALRLGLPLETVLDSVREWRSGVPGEGLSEEERAVAMARKRAQTEEERIIEQNNRALAELRRMMPGLGV